MNEVPAVGSDRRPREGKSWRSCPCLGPRHEGRGGGEQVNKLSNRHSKITNKLWKIHFKEKHFVEHAWFLRCKFTHFFKIHTPCKQITLRWWSLMVQCHICKYWVLWSTLTAYNIAVPLCWKSSKRYWVKCIKSFNFLKEEGLRTWRRSVQRKWT